MRRFSLAALAVVSLAGVAQAAGVYNVSVLSNAPGSIGYDPDKPAPAVTADGFYATGTTGQYNSVRFTPDAIGMGGLTLGQIVGVAYQHKQAGGGQDWQLKVYTEKVNAGDAGWYGYRLNYDLSVANVDGSWGTFTDTNATGERINTYANRFTPNYLANQPAGYAADLAAAANLKVMFFDISAGALTGGFPYDTYLQDISITADGFGTSTVTAAPVPLPASALGGVVLMGLGALRRNKR